MQVRERVQGVIRGSKALNNSFYDLWLQRRLTLREFLVFANEYFAWVQSFPDTLLLLAFHTPNIKDKLEFLSTVWSESGYGRVEKVHWRLCAETLGKVVEKLGGQWQPTTDLVATDYSNLLPTTKNLILGERELYTTAQRARAAGAQVALELSAFSMLWLVNRGLERHYEVLWDNPVDFCRDVQEYTLVHIASAEKDHEEEALRVGEQYADDPELFAQFMEGLNGHLELIAAFWEGVHRALA